MSKKEFAELIEDIVDRKIGKRLEQVEVVSEKNEARILELELEKDCLNAQMKDLKDKIEKLGDAQCLLQKDNIRNTQLALDNEQYSRKNSVRVFGIAAPENRQKEREENCKKLVCDMINSSPMAMDINLMEKNLNVAHRVGKVVNGKQPILAVFYDRDVRQAVLKERSKLKGSGTSIGEDLCEANLRLLNRLQSEPYRDIIESAWYWNGKIKCKGKGSNTIIQVKYMDTKKQIENFLARGKRTDYRWQ